MFEEFKSRNIYKKLEKLSLLSQKFNNIDYTKQIEDLIPNCKKNIVTYTRTFWDTSKDYNSYEFFINNITYGFEEKINKYPFVYIKVKDIVIFHNRFEFSCEGKYQGVGAGWRHKIPKEMFIQLKKDSEIINEYIKNINQYLKYRDKFIEEQKELMQIFCNKK
ncbi:hypothetical protein QB607_003013 [Clostridium botulinum]|nr:hypothetical protein [Clostridium botulinum]EKS4395687.1 hypothetical protein [Clostridium botulinum]